MRAVVCVPGGTELAELPDPVPAPDGVVVAVDACGLCGSDVHMVEHGRAVPGQVLGHEFAGRIVAVGRDAGRWRIGQPVAVNPLGGCGSCQPCRRQLPFRCQALPNLGLTAPGAYAEYVAVPQAQLVALPAEVEPEVGAHAEPLAVALRAVRLGRPVPGEPALVYGVGSIGLNVIMALRLAGAGTIVAVGRSAGRRAAAEALGADVVLDSRVTPPAEYAAEHGLAFGTAYECSAAVGALAETVAVLAPGGVAVQVALNSAPESLDARGLVGRGLTVVGSCAFDADDYAQAVGHLLAGRIDGAALVSERVALAEVPETLVRLRRPGDLVRVLVRP
ncbi:zinc-dependent alcohol dehydrogenase [Plantactinospora endophytica]|uniref:2,3-butanediol dehydrogenase n=1 Tax=Plantactinospora endophytica TaxID=673535 RepID=A0ABQ4EA51_9ACTN|nr:alcohol dehydrogenase catalytic domain-containing protein [Plantactinospora endophytica]GIG91535.1 2,3-butanediol dehydrogenase [Plantactinospora endophytica]